MCERGGHDRAGSVLGGGTSSGAGLVNRPLAQVELRPQRRGQKSERGVARE